MDFPLDHAELIALIEVILIDITLAGDNAIVVGLAAARVEKSQRAKVIFWGIAAAVVMRICFALVTTKILLLPGIMFVGGLLLAFVCIRLGWELFAHGFQAASVAGADGGLVVESAPKPMRQAILQIVVADLSMSLDNVLAVAGAALQHPIALITGLVLSVALMGAAATFIARLLNRFPWVGWAGLLIIVYVAGKMMMDGWHDFWPLIRPFMPHST